MAGQRCMALPSAICHHQQHRHQAGAHYADSTANSWLAQAAQSSIGSTLAALPARKDWRAAEQPSSRAATKQLSIGAAAARRKSSHRRGEIDGDAVAGRPRLQTMGKQMGKQSGAALGPSLSPPALLFLCAHRGSAARICVQEEKHPTKIDGIDGCDRQTHTHTQSVPGSRAQLTALWKISARPHRASMRSCHAASTGPDRHVGLQTSIPRPQSSNSPSSLEPRASSLEPGYRSTRVDDVRS